MEQPLQRVEQAVVVMTILGGEAQCGDELIPELVLKSF